MICPTCDGECLIEVLDCPNRGPWQECCGGHTRPATCPTCGGIGEVYDDEIREDDQ